jgi:hypothetical protein
MSISGVPITWGIRNTSHQLHMYPVSKSCSHPCSLLEGTSIRAMRDRILAKCCRTDVIATA